MANVISFKDIQKINKDFEQPGIDKTNVGISPFNLLLGKYINTQSDFKGVVIGDFIQASENGFYIGKNMILTEQGLIRPLGYIIDGGDDNIALELTRTNKVSVIDGTNEEETFMKSDIMPIDWKWNWGRPIIDGGIS